MTGAAMDTSVHNLHALLTQLGLPSDEQGMARFLAEHAPLSPQVVLAEAPFWKPAQADFLREKLLEDANWAQAVEQLNVLLRLPPKT